MPFRGKKRIISIYHYCQKINNNEVGSNILLHFSVKTLLKSSKFQNNYTYVHNWLSAKAKLGRFQPR